MALTSMATQRGTTETRFPLCVRSQHSVHHFPTAMRMLYVANALLSMRRLSTEPNNFHDRNSGEGTQESSLLVRSGIARPNLEIKSHHMGMDGYGIKMFGFSDTTQAVENGLGQFL